MGEENPIMLLIPKGVAHGYRVFRKKPATIIYFTTESYYPEYPDENRIPWDDSTIGFSWDTQNR